MYGVWLGRALRVGCYFWICSLSQLAFADEVPADNQPAKQCQNYRVNYYSLVSKSTVVLEDCDIQVIVSQILADKVAAFASSPQNGSNWAFHSVNEDDRRIWLSYETCALYKQGTCEVAWRTYYDSTVYTLSTMSAECPPDNYPLYTDGPHDDGNGYKYCLPVGDPCADKAGEVDNGWKFWAWHDEVQNGIAFTPDGCTAQMNKVTCEPIGVCIGADCTPRRKCLVEGLTYTGDSYKGITGENMPPEYAAQNDPDAQPPEPPTEQSGESDCTPVLNPDTGVVGCHATSYATKEGQTKCGFVNGDYVCTTVDPVGVQTDVSKTQTVTTDADGNTVTTTTTKTDTTTCNGPNCSTSSKTQTSSTTTGSNGAVLGQSSTCVGDGCSGQGDDESDGGGAQDLYESGEKTYQSVLEAFRDRASALPVVSGVDAFFTVSVGGSCPVYSTDVPIFGSITFDQWCGAAMESIWPLVSAVVMAAAAFFAFRIAFL